MSALSIPIQTLESADFSEPIRDDAWEAVERVDAAIATLRRVVAMTLPADDETSLTELLGIVVG